jgi:hypothetical protein
MRTNVVMTPATTAPVRTNAVTTARITAGARHGIYGVGAAGIEPATARL